MKLKSLFSALLLGCAMMAQAQSANDPTIMTINGQPISRSEFEYSYNKNNSDIPIGGNFDITLIHTDRIGFG